MMSLVSMDRVSKIFGSGARTVRALDGVSLTIDRGEFLAIIGQSGSGKTSLVTLAGLLDRPCSGSVRFLGSETSSLGSDALSELRNRHIGFVFQSYHLLPRRNAVENVGLALLYRGTPRHRRRRMAVEALRRVGLGHRLLARPTTLSGGEQQRVAIARALVGDPELIIADEPTGALDTATGAGILDLLAGLHRDGRTIVLVTHDLAVASRAERVIAMSDGQLLADRRMRAA